MSEQTILDELTGAVCNTYAPDERTLSRVLGILCPIIDRKISSMTDKNSLDINRFKKVLSDLIDYANTNTCLHEETHRGGVLWEICDVCGMKWADDEGGKPEDAHNTPKAIDDAYLLLSEMETQQNGK